MSEAIEEVEEDDEEDGPVIPKSEHDETALGVHIVDARPSDEQAIPPNRRPFTERHLGDPNLQRSLDTVEIVNGDDEPRLHSCSLVEKPIAPMSADQTTVNASFQNPEHGQLAGLTAPQTPVSMPSPDFTKSSFDKHNDLRIHTAHSSITDRATLNSGRTGDQRTVSVDDVPSLTSSASTMISGHPMQYPIGVGPLGPGNRSLSMSAAVPSRARPGSSSKRSSLVSLSRLVGSSHNKSKLNIAELAPVDSPEKPEKKRKRMSRLKFWKSRERLNAA